MERPRNLSVEEWETLSMPVEDDPAWPRYSNALDQLIVAKDRFAAFPEGHPDKRAAWTALSLALGELNAAANEIEPKYKGP
jgi:hypothetical protein